MKPHSLLFTFLPAAALLVSALPGRTQTAVRCPVTGKEVAVAASTPRVLVAGKPLYFCCPNCPAAFAKAPEKYVKEPGNCPVLGSPATADVTGRVVVNNAIWYACCPNCAMTAATAAPVLKELADVVSGKKFKASENSPRADYEGQVYFFESKETLAAFSKEPKKYAVVYGK